MCFISYLLGSVGRVSDTYRCNTNDQKNLFLSDINMKLPEISVGTAAVASGALVAGVAIGFTIG